MIGSSSPSARTAPPVGPAPAAVEVKPVASRHDLKEFIEFPYRLYADDPAWVPPLLTEQRHEFSPRNPFFQHARVQLFVAYRGAQPVGRISAQIDALRLERYDDATGHFGVLEAIDDPAVFAALLHAAEEWLRAQGMRRVIGPFNLSINGDIGILIDGFAFPPVVLTGHGRRYYDARVQEQGYHKTKDVVAYSLDPAATPRGTLAERARQAQEGARIHIRPIDKTKLHAEVTAISTVFNDAWADNWGFVPFTEAEFGELANALKWIVPAELVQLAYVGDELAAMLIILPNLNELIAGLRGRLLPFGWLRLLWRLRRHPPRSARVAQMGVRRKFQNTTLTMALTFGLIEAVREPILRRQMRYLEMGWVLEDNFRMLRIMRLLGGHRYKTYRVYEKLLV